MTAMNYYSTLNYFDKFHISIEDIDVSLEEGKSLKDRFLSLIEKIKNAFKRVKEFIVGIGKKMYQGFRFMLDKLFKRKPVTDKQFKLLNKADRLILLKNILIGVNGRTVNYINSDGSVVDFEQYQKMWKEAKDAVTKLLDNESSSVNDIDHRIITNIQLLGNRAVNGLNVDDGDTFRKVKLDQLYKLLDEKTLEKMQSELPSLEKSMGELAKVTKDFEKKLDEASKKHGFFSEEHTRISMHFSKYQIIQGLTVSKMQYYHSVIGLNRIFSHELNLGFVFSEPLPAGIKLYHISSNDDLGNELHPQYPKSGDFKGVAKKENIQGYLSVSDQILPKRISFSPNVEGCANGASFYYRDALRGEYGGKLSSDGVLSYEIYLYEGIVDKETKHIKPEYVKQTVADYEASKEICVTTSTKIKKLGKIKVYLDNNNITKGTDLFGGEFTGIGKFIKYEFIEKN